MALKESRIGKVSMVMGLASVVLACTCGPLSQIQQTVQDVQEIATQVEEVAPTLQAAATEFEDMQPTLDALGTQGAEIDAGGDTSGADDTSGGGSSGDTALCDLLTDADFQAQLGQGVSSTSHEASTDGSVVCIYSLADYSVFSASILVGDDQATTDQTWESGFKTIFGTGGEAISGSWDDGFWSTSFNGVYFKKGLYIVYALHSSGADTKEGVINLMKLLADRLP